MRQRQSTGNKNTFFSSANNDISLEVIDVVIVFIEKQTDFFISIVNNKDKVWLIDNNDLSGGFFQALCDKFSKKPKMRDNFVIALIGDNNDTKLNTPCIKNGCHILMYNLLCENIGLTHLIAKNLHNPAIKKWSLQNALIDDRDDTSFVIQKAIDFLEERKDFFFSLFEDSEYSREWTDENNNLSNGFFEALGRQVFLIPLMRAQFRIALIGNVLPQYEKPCLKNGDRKAMHELLSKNVALALLMEKNLNNPAIEKWYKQHGMCRKPF